MVGRPPTLNLVCGPRPSGTREPGTPAGICRLTGLQAQQLVTRILRRDYIGTSYPVEGFDGGFRPQRGNVPFFVWVRNKGQGLFLFLLRRGSERVSLRAFVVWACCAQVAQWRPTCPRKVLRGRTGHFARRSGGRRRGVWAYFGQVTLSTHR